MVVVLVLLFNATIVTNSIVVTRESASGAERASSERSSHPGELNPALVLGLVLGNVVNPGEGDWLGQVQWLVG